VKRLYWKVNKGLFFPGSCVRCPDSRIRDLCQHSISLAYRILPSIAQGLHAQQADELIFEDLFSIESA
jgi:hypothetical protein